MHTDSHVEPFVVLLERLDDVCGGVGPAGGAAAGTAAASASAGCSLEGSSAGETGEPETVWRERLGRAFGAIGLQPQETWLSAAEVAGGLQRGQPAVLYRRTEELADGWILLLDSRRGRFLVADLSGAGRDRWLSVEDLCRTLEIGPEHRLS